jgi:hypothetical protein
MGLLRITRIWLRQGEKNPKSKIQNPKSKIQSCPTAGGFQFPGSRNSIPVKKFNSNGHNFLSQILQIKIVIFTPNKICKDESTGNFQSSSGERIY